jgi:hypothetical protein
MSRNGKGSNRRKALVPDKQVSDNWKRTFGKRKKEKKDVAAPRRTVKVYT